MYRMELALIIVMGVNDLHARFIIQRKVFEVVTLLNITQICPQKSQITQTIYQI